MTNGHLQRDEAAIAITEHDRVLAAGGVLHRFRHPVGHFQRDLRSTASERPKPGNSGTIVRNDFDSSGTMASKLARSDSSEWNKNNGGPSPDCAALTV